MKIESSTRDATSGTSYFVDAIMLLAIFWLRLPAAFGTTPSTTVRVVALIPLAIGVVVLLPLSRPRRAISLLGALVAVFELIIVVALFRGASAHAFGTTHQVVYEALGISVLVTFSYLYFASAPGDRARDRRMFILCCAPGCYVAINVMLHLSGFSVAATPGEPSAVINAGVPAELLGLVGVHSSRVLFPFANGINNFGDIAGIALVVSAILAVKTGGSRRIVAMSFLLSAIYALFATDARGALVFSICAILLALWCGRRRRLAYIAFIVPFTVFITEALLSLISDTSLVTTFSRSGTDLATASNRTFIWEKVLGVLAHPTITQIYGYGAGGQISSGASQLYDYLFASAPHPDQYTAHNFMLQTVLDTGYVGLAAFVLLLFSAGRRLQKMIARDDSGPARALLGVLVFLVFAGATDGAPSLYTPETLYFLFLLVTCAAATRFPASPQRAVRPRSYEYYHQNSHIYEEYQTI